MISGRAKFPLVAHVLLRRPVEDSSGVELFLLRRANTGVMDGLWTPPGGHMQRGEAPTAGAQRECQEEAGVLAQVKPACVLPYCSPVSSASGETSGEPRFAQGVNFLFTSERWDGVPGLAEPEDFSACGWHGVNALPEACVPWLPQVLAMLDAGEWYAEFT